MRKRKKEIPRGKLNKIRKMMEKYAYSDDEEREFIVQIIGAKKRKDGSQGTSSI